MRNNELNEGIDVVDDKNNVIGTSKVAAKKVKLNCWHTFSTDVAKKVEVILCNVSIITGDAEIEIYRCIHI
jgi:hypothetical protein